jgi:AraC-like DNA-binding protein
VGSEAFRQEQLQRMEGRLGEHHSGQMRLESAEAKAERIIAQELRRLGWTEEELARCRKNDAGKMAMAVRLRRETTLSVKAIAARVRLGTSYTANKRLHQAMKALPTPGPASRHSDSEQKTKESMG